MEVLIALSILAIIIIKLRKTRGDTAGQKIDSMTESAKSKVREIINEKG